MGNETSIEVMRWRGALRWVVLGFCAGLCGCAGRDPLAGRWEGQAVYQGAAQRLIVDITPGEEGPQAALTVPEAFQFAKPLEAFLYDQPAVHFELPAGGVGRMRFDGERQGDRIKGTLKAGRLSARIALRRSGEVPPLPYVEEEVRFRGGDRVLSGSLLRPRTAGPHPAVVLIHGSSTPSREDFRFMADLFCRAGIAALVYDKRDFGTDQEGPHRYDLLDLAADAEGAVDFLAGRGDMDPRRIGLWGFSQGGWVAPIVAARSDRVAFVISVSGPGVSCAEVNLYADSTRLRARGFSEEQIREARVVQQRLDDHVRHGAGTRAVQALLDQAWTRPWAAYTTLPRRAPTAAERSSWYRWRILDFDVVPYWEQVSVPVLAVFGELDDAVPVERSAESIGGALERAGNREVTIRVYPGAGHEITLPMGPRPDTGGCWDWARPAPGFPDEMIRWARERTRAGH